jgi:hypothetical protein
VFAQEWGTLRGQFVYDGAPPPRKPLATPGVAVNPALFDESLVVDPETKGIAHIVIYVRTKDVKVHPGYVKAAKPAKFDNKNFRFEPRILTNWIADPGFEFTSSDMVAHNSNYQPIGDLAVNPLLPPGASQGYQAAREQSIPQIVSCSIHPWMKGYVLSRNNPYMTVTKADGSFELKDLPVGELEFQIWHELPGYLAVKKEWEKGRFKLKIKAGDNALSADGAALKVAPDLLKSK